MQEDHKRLQCDYITIGVCTEITLGIGGLGVVRLVRHKIKCNIIEVDGLIMSVPGKKVLSQFKIEIVGP